MTARPVFLTLPRPSLTTVLLTLPTIFDRTRGNPLVLMDQYDFDRLRAEVLSGPTDNKKAPYLIMIYEELIRRGHLRLIDYTKFYDSYQQDHCLTQSQTLLQNISECENRRVAVNASENWIKFTRGQYQECFRSGLGENPRSFRKLRRSEYSQRQKLKNEVADPRSWNEKLLSRGLAALAVRKEANAELPLDIRGIITGTQYQVIGEFIDQESESTTTSATDTLASFEAKYQFLGMDVDSVSRTQEILQTISQITTELAGVQYDDWLLVSPTLAVPQYNDLFEMDLINREVGRLSQQTLIQETKRAVKWLEQKSPPTEKLQYEMGWVNEEFDSALQHDSDLLSTIDYAYSTSNYSRCLRSLLEETDIHQVSALLGVSIVSGTYRARTDEEIYHHGVRLKSLLDPPSITAGEIQSVHKERRGDTWEEHTDWFESMDRNQRYC